MVKCFMFWKSQSTHKTFAVSLKPWHLCFWLCHCKTLCAISFLKLMLYPDAKCHPQWGPLYKNVHNYMPQSLPKGFECPFWEQTWTDSQGSVLQVWNSNLTAQKTEDHSYCIWKDVLSAHTHNVLYTTDLSFERTMSHFCSQHLSNKSSNIAWRRIWMHAHGLLSASFWKHYSYYSNKGWSTLELSWKLILILSMIAICKSSMENSCRIFANNTAKPSSQSMVHMSTHLNQFIRSHTSLCKTCQLGNEQPGNVFGAFDTHEPSCQKLHLL
jgi:hypothetical protein